MERARTILSEVQEAQAELSNVQTKEVLHVGVLTTIAACFRTELAARLPARPTGTVLELFEGTERELNIACRASGSTWP